MTQTVGLSTASVGLQMTQRREVFDMPKEQDCPEGHEQAQGMGQVNILRFKQDHVQGAAAGSGQSPASAQAGHEQSQSSPAQKGLVGEWLDMSQQKKQNQQVKRGDFPPLPSEDSTCMGVGALHPPPGSSAQKRHGPARAGSGATKISEGWSTSYLRTS